LRKKVKRNLPISKTRYFEGFDEIEYLLLLRSVFFKLRITPEKYFTKGIAYLRVFPI